MQTHVNDITSCYCLSSSSSSPLDVVHLPLRPRPLPRPRPRPRPRSCAVSRALGTSPAFPLCASALMCPFLGCGGSSSLSSSLSDSTFDSSDSGSESGGVSHSSGDTGPNVDGLPSSSSSLDSMVFPNRSTHFSFLFFALGFGLRWCYRARPLPPPRLLPRLHPVSRLHRLATHHLRSA